MRFKFDWCRNEETGECGWKKVGNNFFEPFVGNLAHDILEHFHKSDASIEDELMAFESIVAGRGMAGDFRDGVVEGIKDDLIRTWWSYAIHLDRSYVRPTYKRVRLGGAVGDAIKEVIDASYQGNDEVTETLQNTPWDDQETKDRIASWMWLGYQKWKRRFGNPSPYDFAEHYRYLNDRINQFNHSAEEGDQLIVTVVGMMATNIRIQRHSYG